jgi:hypothetical protein
MFAAVLLLPWATAGAQEISESHLAAAERAMVAAPQIGNFDDILPFLSVQVQNRLIRDRPDLFAEIAAAVEVAALKLTARRADLNNDVARIWARAFSEEELDQIATFFASPAGEKYKELAPTIGEDILKVSQGWMNRVNEELLDRTREELKKEGYEF